MSSMLPGSEAWAPCGKVIIDDVTMNAVTNISWCLNERKGVSYVAAFIDAECLFYWVFHVLGC